MEKGSLKNLLDLTARLRGPDGCPWDRRQTMEDLKGYLLDEAYEVLDAIDRYCPQALQEELGDLLFQIVFLSRIAEERGEFTFEDVIRSISEKMVRRHPHVFGDLEIADVEDVRQNWKRIKESEGKPSCNSILPDLPGSLPGLYRAQKIQGIVSKNTAPPSRPIEDILQEVEGQWEEFKGNVKQDPRSARIEERMGDLLFALADLGRILQVDCERVLRETTETFIRRFRFLEETLRSEGKDIQDIPSPREDRIGQDAQRMDRRKIKGSPLLPGR